MDVTIRLVIDNPSEGNTIQVSVRDTREEWRHYADGHGAYVYSYQFSAESHPLEWIHEALMAAGESIQNGGHTFWEEPLPSWVLGEAKETTDVIADRILKMPELDGDDEIPF